MSRTFATAIVASAGLKRAAQRRIQPQAAHPLHDARRRTAEGVHLSRLGTRAVVGGLLVGGLLVGGLGACDNKKAAPKATTTTAPQPSLAPAKLDAAPTSLELPPAPPPPAVPRGLPPLPAHLTLDANAIAWGAVLFADPALSSDGKRACTTCHEPSKSFAGETIARAADGRPNARRSPALVNLAWQTEYGWDGRFTDLETMLAAHMRGQLGLAPDAAVNKLATTPLHAAHLARQAAATPVARAMLHALMQFVQTRFSGNSQWDQVERAPTPPAQLKAGYTLFVDKARCGHCHVPPMYTDFRYHRLGLVASADQGRGAVDPQQAGAFRTPSLRGLTGRAVFFHDASAPSLRHAVDWHLAGGRGQQAAPSLIDPALAPIALTADEYAALLAFVNALATPSQDPNQPSTDQQGAP